MLEKFVKLSSLVNSGAITDYLSRDKISIRITSDALKKSITFGEYYFNVGDVVDLENITIPCKKLLHIEIREIDVFRDDINSFDFYCDRLGNYRIDFTLPKLYSRIFPRLSDPEDYIPTPKFCYKNYYPDFVYPDLEPVTCKKVPMYFLYFSTETI